METETAEKKLMETEFQLPPNLLEIFKSKFSEIVVFPDLLSYFSMDYVIKLLLSFNKGWFNHIYGEDSEKVYNLLKKFSIKLSEYRAYILMTREKDIQQRDYRNEIVVNMKILSREIDLFNDLMINVFVKLIHKTPLESIKIQNHYYHRASMNIRGFYYITKQELEHGRKEQISEYEFLEQ